VFAARPASARQLFAQMFAGTVQAHNQIIFGQTKGGGNGSGIVPVQIYTLEQIAVLLRHDGKQSLETLAKQSFVLCSHSIGKLFFKLLHCALPRIATAIEVNDGATQDALKPRHRIFIVRRLLGRIQRLDEAFLHHVFSKVRVAQVLARKSDERVQVFEHGFFHVLHL
jgi:hypothetical protein